jgi:hypothetical protein
MNSEQMKMNRSSIQLGFWSASLCVVAFVVFMVCFVAIPFVNPMFSWTNLSDYVVYENGHNQFLKYLAQFAMLLFGALYVILLASIQELAHDDKKILTRIASYFGIGFAALIGINYFVQISAVRLNVLNGRTQGLDQFIQSNPTSGIAAVNMLGWTLFLGLSSLFVAPVFSGGRLERIIRYAFLANGIICLIGGIGYIFDLVLIVYLCMDLGMGAALLVATTSLSILFRRMDKSSVLNEVNLASA